MAKKPTEPTTTDAPVEALPTYAEAQAMFAERPDLHAVMTDEGRLTRDGVLTPTLKGE